VVHERSVEVRSRRVTVPKTAASMPRGRSTLPTKKPPMPSIACRSRYGSSAPYTSVLSLAARVSPAALASITIVGSHSDPSSSTR